MSLPTIPPTDKCEPSISSIPDCLEIQTGQFAKEFILENRAGVPSMKAMRRMAATLPIEVVGARLREMMPWIKKNRLVDQPRN